MRHRVNFDKILCGCGCGEELFKYDDRRREQKYIHGHNARGKKNPNMARFQPKGSEHWNWKGGKYTTQDGYVKIYCPDHPYNDNGYVLEHRLKIEKKLGRYLHPDEHVHHKNGITTDNRLSNLKKTSNSEHMSGHRKKDIRDGKVLFGGQKPWSKKKLRQK